MAIGVGVGDKNSCNNIFFEIKFAKGDKANLVNFTLVYQNSFRT